MKKTEQELNAYKQRLVEISQIPSIKNEIEAYLKRNNLKNILDVGSSATNNNGVVKQENGHQKVETANIIDFNGAGELVQQKSECLVKVSTYDLSHKIIFLVPPVPPRSADNLPTIGTKLEGLLLHELEPDDDDFDPRSFENNSPASQPANLPFSKLLKKIQGVIYNSIVYSCTSSKTGQTNQFNFEYTIAAQHTVIVYSNNCNSQQVLYIYSV